MMTNQQIIEGIRRSVNHSLLLLEVDVPKHLIDLIIGKAVSDYELFKTTPPAPKDFLDLHRSSFQAGLDVLFPIVRSEV